MPRIELIPPDWEGSKEQQQGDGTPCEDFCRRCAARFEEGELIAFVEGGEAIVGEKDVDHPCYSEDVYECDNCGCRLRDYDN